MAYPEPLLQSVLGCRGNRITQSIINAMSLAICSLPDVTVMGCSVPEWLSKRYGDRPIALLYTPLCDATYC